jgi:hypothetical protein
MNHSAAAPFLFSLVGRCRTMNSSLWPAGELRSNLAAQVKRMLADRSFERSGEQFYWQMAPGA